MEVHINNIDNDLYITFDSAMNILDEIQRLRKENKELVKYKDICFRYEKLLDKEYEKLITYNLDNINNLKIKDLNCDCYFKEKFYRDTVYKCIINDIETIKENFNCLVDYLKSKGE